MHTHAYLPPKKPRPTPAAWRGHAAQAPTKAVEPPKPWPANDNDRPRDPDPMLGRIGRAAAEAVVLLVALPILLFAAANVVAPGPAAEFTARLIQAAGLA